MLLVLSAFTAGCQFSFWGECVLAAAHLINRTPFGILLNKTPYEMLFGCAPSYKNLHIVGCFAFAHNQRAKGENLLVATVNVSLWAIHSVRRVGVYSNLRNMSSLYLGR